MSSTVVLFNQLSGILMHFYYLSLSGLLNAQTSKYVKDVLKFPRNFVCLNN
jgi:hypothetical protein